VNDLWAEAPLETLLHEVGLNPFQEDKLAAYIREQAAKVTEAMRQGGHAPESPWPAVRQLTEEYRHQLVTDFQEAQQRLREALERIEGMPPDWREQPGYDPGAFRARPMRWPGPARGGVRKLVRAIVAQDYCLALITEFEEEMG
jgi:hypothetical protein